MGKCKHQQSTHLIKPVEKRRTVSDMYDEIHSEGGQSSIFYAAKKNITEFTCKAVTSVDFNQNDTYSVLVRAVLGHIPDRKTQTPGQHCTLCPNSLKVVKPVRPIM